MACHQKAAHKPWLKRGHWYSVCVCVQDLSLQAESKLKKQGFLFGIISYLGMNGVIVAITRLSD